MRLEAEFQNIASCRDSDAAPQAIRRHAPDNTLIDYAMPELDEVYILSTVRSERIRHPNCIA